jgi:hypothetical protein
VPSAVLLVGGFGQCAYLRERIRKLLEVEEIEVLQCPNGLTAIVEGALMKHLSNTPSSSKRAKVWTRNARKSCGLVDSVEVKDKKPEAGHRFDEIPIHTHFIC